MSITINNLQKNYGNQKAVNNISFTVNKGEIVGFLGPNGAGKSTTMKIITGYLSPTAGTATVCGLDVALHPNEVKKHIGYLPESNALYYEMYIMEYLEMVAKMYNLKTMQPVYDVVKKVGLTPEYTKKIGQLSKGYKQRVGIAAALIHNPNVLILDEPTSGLDPNQIVEIRNVIKEIGKEKTVLFSTHIMQEVEAICSRVIIINQGQILADDSLQNITKQKQSTKLIVTFNDAVNENIFDGIIGAQKIDTQTYSFTATNTDAIKRQIMQLALNKNLNITSMQNETQNLENVFRTLTKK